LFNRPLLLNQWFPFNEVGRYHVAINVPGVEGTANLWVNIAARDEGRLRAVCETLIEDASQLSERGIHAALALSFVSGDLTIPYLARMASGSYSGSPCKIWHELTTRKPSPP
jgi:hypothetical protein